MGTHAQQQQTLNQTPAPTRVIHSSSVANTPDWSALTLFNQYRLILLLALAAVYYLSDDQRTLGTRNSDLFEVLHLGYLVTTLGFVYLIRIQTPTVNTQFFIQNYLDILFISGLMYASGGVQSGLGPVLLVNLAILSQLASVRHALLFASISSMIVMGEELLARLLVGPDAVNFESTAVLGSLLFATAWIMSVPVRRLMSRQMVRSSRSRVVLDVEHIAHLNEEIIRELDSGVIVVDSNNNIQLINDTARALLSAEFKTMPLHLRKLCPELLTSLQTSERSPTHETRPFSILATGQSLLPQFIALSKGGMLIKIDDHAHIRKQFQQLKMASLGKLSASIAHEIRNPLGAISHAVQLIQESPTLDPKDAELLLIAKRHTQRINRIVEDVLQLSNRQQMNHEVVSVDKLVHDFAKRFVEENGLNKDRIAVTTVPSRAMVDPGHLDQVLWNLCTNAHVHNQYDTLTMHIHCWQSESGVTVVDVIDNGKGISDIDIENLFDPFYSTHHAGTGLGLYIIRELCELNNAKIECVPSQEGAHFRMTLASSQNMAA
ncbi:MAG: two-component system sensor histidine kinase PilS (NtrC family) [Pseudomonadales bacterium]|jgi:two-component system sensor histidine kinase PilS (NtrC family)